MKFCILFLFPITLCSNNVWNKSDCNHCNHTKNVEFGDELYSELLLKEEATTSCLWDGTEAFSTNQHGFAESEDDSFPDQPKSPLFKMTFYGGLSYRVGKKHDNPLREDMDKFRFGFHGGADLGFLFPKYFGLGMKFDLCNIQNIGSNDGYHRNMNITFLGPLVSFRKGFLKDKINLLTSASVGYMTYWVDGSKVGLMIGSTIGMAFALGFECKVTKNLFLGSKASFIDGNALLGVNPSNNQKVYEGLNRLDFSFMIKIVL